MEHTKSKTEAWRERIKHQRESGLTQKGYCHKRGLALSTFRYWKQRLAEPVSGTFVQLRRENHEGSMKRMRLIIPGGVKVIFNSSSSLATVTAVLETLCTSTGSR